MFYLNSTLNFGVLTVLVFQLEVDRLLTSLTAQQKGTTARWYSNKTSLLSGLIRIWSAMKITQQYLLNSRNKNRN